jgi:CHAT domain-containing protein
VTVDRATLEAALAQIPRAQRESLRSGATDLAALDFAQALKQMYFAHNMSSPEVASGAAAALEILAQREEDPHIRALAEWLRGMACELRGDMEASIRWLRQASARFEHLGDSHSAARVQVSLLTAYAMLGRYSDALACGETARAFFIRVGDELSAGKVEQNLGGIQFRRDHYREAEHLLRCARDRFLKLDDQKQLTQIENNIAIALTLQHRFGEAAALYEQALARAEAGGFDITQAEIEDDLGQLALHQGKYERALDYIERARRRFEALGIAHAAAAAQGRLADAYLDLNLVPEAVSNYQRALSVFRGLGMRAEEAATLANLGRGYALLGEPEQAHAALSEARQIFLGEDNEVGQATVRLAEAQLLYDRGAYEDAMTAAALAHGPLETAASWGRLLHARWVQGDSLRAVGQLRPAQRLLSDTLKTAQAHGVPQTVLRCESSLGLLSLVSGNLLGAERRLKRAVELSEQLRAPLPAEEFRTAFLTDKLVAFRELVRMCVASGRSAEALEYVERSRSRSLVDVLSGELAVRLEPRDASESEMLERARSLREELNWLYSQINRSERDKAVSAARLAELHAIVRDRERDVQEMLRQVQQSAPAASPLLGPKPFVLADFQRDLPTDTALLEYYLLDDEVVAFVVTRAHLEVVRSLATRQQVETALAQLQFQLESLRGGSARIRGHMPQLTARVRHHLKSLHDLLLSQIEPRIGARRLVVVPHSRLHYVPFHALFDGSSYTIERREVSYAPSASVLHQCLHTPLRPYNAGLFVGVADEQIPRAEEEARALSRLFINAKTLIGTEASRAAVREHVDRADLLHLACHGKFRPDNPLFSALHLGDGWLTVRDAYELDLKGRLVTLSACQTGLSSIGPGDELAGLLRGFFSAGSPCLVLSQWTVDDDSTRELMQEMYTRLRAGDRPAAALRAAQRAALEQYQHPFFWAPFAVFGRW